MAKKPILPKRNQQRTIISIKNELLLCKKKIEELGEMSFDGLSKYDIAKIKRDLEVETRRKEVLKRKLKQYGYKDGRGRPKKESSQLYASKHEKFTAMLLPENLSYLQELKKQKHIKNISAFLDELIQHHRETSSS